MPMPTMDWKARWVRLTGGRWSTGMVSRPWTGLVKELRAMIEPIRGMSIDPRTCPSTSTPPSRNGDGLSVFSASSKAASLAGWVSATRSPST